MAKMVVFKGGDPSYSPTISERVGVVIAEDSITEPAGTVNIYTVPAGKVAKLVFFCQFDQGTNTTVQFYTDRNVRFYKKATAGTGFTNTTPFLALAYDSGIQLQSIQRNSNTSSNPYSYMLVVVEENAFDYYNKNKSTS